MRPTSRAPTALASHASAQKEDHNIFETRKEHVRKRSTQGFATKDAKQHLMYRNAALDIANRLARDGAREPDRALWHACRRISPRAPRAPLALSILNYCYYLSGGTVWGDGVACRC